MANSIYKIPDEFFFRLHHVRPRFKSNLENVLVYVAEAISNLGEKNKDIFINEFNSAIYHFPGNAHRKLKTMDNWRTEISSLFGFILSSDDKYRPGLRAIELAKHQDLVECFKIFLYNFQYPGAHIKPKSVLEQIQRGIKFKPAQYILKLLKYANESSCSSTGITKAEVCHCIFNDLRVTRDHRDVKDTWQLIINNRKNKIGYDQTGDVIRYAGDIVDYMEYANLLKTYNSKIYYLNSLEEETILKFTNSTEWFDKYDSMISSRSGSLSDISKISTDWFNYVNRKLVDTDFTTDILSYIASNEQEFNELKKDLSELPNDDDFFKRREYEIHDKLDNDDSQLRTKDIGDFGEALVHGHECMRVKIGGRADLIHLIKRIPTQFAVGYDISSVELDERKRFIEVKTTISSKPLTFNRIHLTKNEWNTADSTRDRYYIYRLLLSKTETKLFLLQDPVGLYKNDRIKMVPSSDGADITFDPKEVGGFKEILKWKN